MGPAYSLSLLLRDTIVALSFCEAPTLSNILTEFSPKLLHAETFNNSSRLSVPISDI